MKQKKIIKKLSLNKKTIAHLNNTEMRYANGGGPVTDKCPITHPYYCPTVETCENSCGGTACESVCTSDPCCTIPFSDIC